MNESEIRSAEDLREWYGDFSKSGANLKLNRFKIPSPLWPLIPYAEFWGIADDVQREHVVLAASPEIRANFKQTVLAFNDELDKWLASDVSPNIAPPSDEYVAFSAMLMAADFI